MRGDSGKHQSVGQVRQDMGKPGAAGDSRGALGAQSGINRLG